MTAFRSDGEGAIARQLRGVERRIDINQTRIHDTRYISNQSRDDRIDDGSIHVEGVRIIQWRRHWDRDLGDGLQSAQGPNLIHIIQNSSVPHSVEFPPSCNIRIVRPQHDGDDIW